MPLPAITSDGVPVFASRMSREDRKEQYYYCRACGGELRLRIPMHRITHFFHLTKGNCVFGGEGEMHLEAKQFLFDEMSKHYDDVGMEFKTTYEGITRISDIIVPVSASNFGKIGTVIEVQNSPITSDEVNNRITDWRERGYGILWVITKDTLGRTGSFMPDRGGMRFTVRNLPKWIRNLYKIMNKRLYIYSDRRIFLAKLEPPSYGDGDYHRIIAHPIINLFLTAAIMRTWTPYFAQYVDGDRDDTGV